MSGNQCDEAAVSAFTLMVVTLSPRDADVAHPSVPSVGFNRPREFTYRSLISWSPTVALLKHFATVSLEAFQANVMKYTDFSINQSNLENQTDFPSADVGTWAKFKTSHVNLNPPPSVGCISCRGTLLCCVKPAQTSLFSLIFPSISSIISSRCATIRHNRLNS